MRLLGKLFDPNEREVKQHFRTVAAIGHRHGVENDKRCGQERVGAGAVDDRSAAGLSCPRASASRR